MCSSKRRGEENCNNKSINIDFIEGLVWEHFFAQGHFRKHLNDHFRRLEDEPRLKEIEASIEEAQAIIKEQNKQLNNLVKSVASGIFDDSDIRQNTKTIKTNIADAELKLKRLQEQRSNYNSLNQNSESIENDLLSIEKSSIPFVDKKAFIKEYLEETIIHFDEPTQHYFIEIIPRIEGMEKIVFVAPLSKKFAYEFVRSDIAAKGYDRVSYYKDFSPEYILIAGFDATFERIFGRTWSEEVEAYDRSN